MSTHINFARNCCPFKLRRPGRNETIAVAKFKIVIDRITECETRIETGEVEHHKLTHSVLVIPRNSILHPLQKLPEPYRFMEQVPIGCSAAMKRTYRSTFDSICWRHRMITFETSANIHTHRELQHQARMDRQALARSKRDEGWLGL